jgi:uncharacterized protein
MDNHRSSDAPESSTQPSRTITRWFWLVAGFVLVGLGVIGVVLPVMPTTVFFIGAAACFARSSPRFEQWVLNLPRFGGMVRDYRSGLGMPRRAKLIASLTIVLAIGISSVFIPSWTARIAAYAFALVGVWFIVAHVPTRERVLDERRVSGDPRR